MRGPSNCEALCFHNGRLDIDESDKDAMEMLEAIADRPILSVQKVSLWI